MRRRNIVLLVLLCSTTALIAQNTNQNLLPNVTGPSPETAQLGKFGSYDVNHFTGVAAIEVPIHNIVAKDIQVPVVLRYHPSGIKVTDRPSWVGLGWSLDAGGFISRQVLGLPDELPQGYANTALPASLDPAINADLHYLNDVNRGLIDAEPDVFSYGFGGYSGKFMLDKMQNSPDANNVVGGTGGAYFNAARIAEAEQGCDDDDVMMIPYRPLDIQPTYGTSSVTFKAFDPYGREYQFDKYETTREVNESLDVRSAWKLTKIISKNGTTEVNFNYAARSGQVSKDRSYSVTVNDLVQNLPGGSTYTADPGIYSHQDHNMWSTEQYLDSITFPLGKINFILSNDDRKGGFPGQKKLDEIRVYQLVDGVYEQIKQIDFVYGYFTADDGSNTERTFLEEVKIKSGAGALVQKYHFDYNTLQKLPDFLSTQQDLWGYYNGRINEHTESFISTPTLVPNHSIVYQALANGSQETRVIGTDNLIGRTPKSSFAQACILNQITYPTGGYTKFIYEGNSYLDGTATVAGPGLRIKEIHTYEDSTATPIKRTFEYGEGRANFLSQHYTFDNEVTHRTIDAHSQALCCTMRSRTYLSSPNIALEPFDQALVVYPRVTVYEGTSSANIGRTIYDYWDYNDTPGPGFQIGTPTIESNHWRRGQLKRMRAYRSNGGGNYSLVQEQNHTYGGFGLCQMGKMGLKVKKRFVNGGDAFWEDGGSANNDVNSFLYAYYRVIRGDDKLLSTEEINYPDSGTPYTVLSEYFYDSYDHQQLTYTTTTSSKGEALSRELYYPHEDSGAVYSDMVAIHQIAFPVIETSLRDNVVVQKLVRNYSEPVTDIFEPTTITTQRDGGTTFTEATFHSYDSYGNPTSFTGRDGVRKSVLWSNEGHYAAVVAEHVDFITLQVAVGFSLPTGYNSLQDLLDNMDDIATNSAAQADWQTFNNNLRSQPTLATAYIQTFTYDPIIGQTSSTDATGLTSYYRYDDHNRLYQVKDFDGNILEEHKYNFKNN